MCVRLEDDRYNHHISTCIAILNNYAWNLLTFARSLINVHNLSLYKWIEVNKIALEGKRLLVNSLSNETA